MQTDSYDGVPGLSDEAILQYQIAVVHAQEHVSIASKVALPGALCYSATVMMVGVWMIARMFVRAMAGRDETLRAAAHALNEAHADGISEIGGRRG